MYTVHVILRNEDGSKDDVYDYVTNKRDVVRFIAREAGVTQKSISGEVYAKSDSSIQHDDEGFRVEVAYA